MPDGPVGMAGVMGGLASSCTAETTDILFEAAFFAPAAIAGRGRRYGLVTDAGQRFERGVDPAHQERADRARHAAVAGDRGRQGGPDARRAGLGRAAAAPGSRAAPRAHRAGCSAPPSPTTTSRRRSKSLGMRVLAERRRLAGDAAAASLRHHHRSRSHRRTGAHRRLRSPSPRADAATRQTVRALPEEAPVESAGARDPRHARLPGSHHLRVRRSGAAGQAVPGRRDAARSAIRFRATWPSCARRCGRGSSRRRRRICAASRIASGCSSMARVSRRGGVRDRSAGRHRHRLAAAGAVGRQGSRRWISST